MRFTFVGAARGNVGPHRGPIRNSKPVMGGTAPGPVAHNGSPVAVANSSRTVEHIQRRAYELLLALMAAETYRRGK
jgi:hypothetical protein